MTVRFRLLGEVEVLHDERRVDVGHDRQRCVLATLLVEVNRPVTVDQLIDRVWADRRHIGRVARCRRTCRGYGGSWQECPASGSTWSHQRSMQERSSSSPHCRTRPTSPASLRVTDARARIGTGRR
jgi:hypothetical protein